MATTDRASFRTKLLLAMVGLLVVLAGGILVGLEIVARRQVPAQLSSELDADRAAVEERLHLDLARLTTEARVVSEEPRIKAVLNTPEVDADTVGDVANETRESAGWSLLGLITADGANHAVAGGSGGDEPPQLAEALRGADASGYWARGAVVYRVVALAVRLGDRRIGALLAGEVLDDVAIEQLGRGANLRLALFAGDKLVAASFTGKPRDELARLAAGATPAQLRLNGEPFLARQLRLSPSVRVAVLSSEEFMLRPLSRLRRTILAVSAAAMIAALILTWILARSLSRPVGELVDLALAVRGHDLEARVVPSGGQELATLGRTMNAMVVELAQQRRRDELASFLVHDLKNPLAAVLGNAEFLLEASSLTQDEREAGRDILVSAELMLRMVMDLLDVGKSADGRLTPRKSGFPIGALVEEIRRRAAARAALRGQKVIVAAGAPLVVTADRELLRRVIDNLLDNCFKYTPSDGTITLGWQIDELGEVEIRVCDEGAGVPAALRERIFDKYFQLDRDVAEHSRTSRGMGLVFCKAAIEAHGGRIWVEDNHPKGSAFRIRLPIG